MPEEVGEKKYILANRINSNNAVSTSKMLAVAGGIILLTTFANVNRQQNNATNLSNFVYHNRY
jgi:aspartokinase-like uncharacterized kinase